MRASFLLGACFAALFLAACDADGDPSGATADPGVFVELLRLMPDRPDVRAAVEMGDVEAMRGQLGIQVPQAEVDGEFNLGGFVEYAVALAPGDGSPSVEPRFLLAGPDSAYLGVFAPVVYQSLGISPLDVDDWISGGLAPTLLSAAHGSFDPDELQAHLDVCAECPAADIEDRGGWRIYAWGEDGAEDVSMRLHPPMFDQLGRGGRLAVSDGALMRALSTGDVQSMVDAAEGDGSLADNEDFRIAAEQLEDLGVLKAWVTDQTPDLSGEEFGGELLLPYIVMAFGPGYDGETPFMAAVVVNETPEDAAENARRIASRVTAAQQAVEERARRAGLTAGGLTEEVEVDVDGRAVLVTLRGDALFDYPAITGANWFVYVLLGHE
ncbi:MAG: hypothetical protein GEU80_10900 [Dehalococcoidia bacterium]|nr:hypothetical protein [Dehalococcoidia bacterium]